MSSVEGRRDHRREVTSRTSRNGEAPTNLRTSERRHDIENHGIANLFTSAEEGDLYLTTHGQYVVVGIAAGDGAMKHFSPEMARDFALSVLRSADMAESTALN